MTPLLTWNWPDTPLVILLILVAAVVLRWVLLRMIKTAVDNSVKVAQDRDSGHATKAERLFSQIGGDGDAARQESRARTLGGVLRSATTIAITVIAALQILDTLGVPMGAVLASAGIGGAALAFGAQSLIKDFISGTFLIMEDQFGVGDYIDTGDVQGYVEDVALRVTRLRDNNGEIWYIRNGEINRVGNASQGWSMATISIPVAPDEDASRVMDVLNKAMTDFYDEDTWSKLLVDAPEVAGVEKVDTAAVTIKIRAKCAPTKNGKVQRGMRGKALTALQEAGIKVPAASTYVPVAAPSGDS